MCSKCVRVYVCLSACCCCCDSYPPVKCEQYGIALDVSMDDSLAVQVGQRLQDALAHRCHLLLVEPTVAKLM